MLPVERKRSVFEGRPVQFPARGSLVKRSIDQKLRLRNFDARHERIETGALVTNRRGQRGVERGPGECYQWRAKGQCSRGGSCSFWHDEIKRAKSTPKSPPTSEPPTQKDGEVYREERVSELGVHLGGELAMHQKMNNHICCVRGGGEGKGGGEWSER